MKQLSIADLEVNELGQSTSSKIDVNACGHCAARAAGAKDKPTAPMRAGCPRWGYDFKKSCGKCKVTGELNPGETGPNYFRCDFEYDRCEHFLRSQKERKCQS